MSLIRLYARGQVTIPKKIREQLGVVPGDTVAIESREGEVVIRKPRGILEAQGVGAPRERLRWEKARAASRDERVRRRVKR